MEYERIEKVQVEKPNLKGIISPTKLRIKLMGPHHNRKREESNSNSSRTSPSQLDVPEDSEFTKNSLLVFKSDVGDNVEITNMDVGEANLPSESVLDLSQSHNTSSQGHSGLRKETRELCLRRPQQFRKGDLSTVHPMRTQEDEILDYDSNASSSSFEFPHGGERLNRNPVPRSFSRQMPSKWNDAQKWIMNRQNMVRKNGSFCGQGNQMKIRVTPENAGHELYKLRTAADAERVDFCQPSQTGGYEKYPLVRPVAHPFQRGSMLVSKSLQNKEVCGTNNLSHDTTVGSAVRSVCMRDMGTEMTPLVSEEPSRTATPVGAATPIRSSTSSLNSTPRAGGGRATAVLEESSSQNRSEITKRELSEQEIKLRTRQEIMALGVQLGKMNIAAWASKEEEEKNSNNAYSVGKNSAAEELQRLEYVTRAASWEEAENSKHTARYKREEIKIQAWESQQRAKLEAEMRRIEAKLEQMIAQAEAKMTKKIVMARQRSEEKHAAAKARKNRDIEKASSQAEYIRQTGRMPASSYMCCGWFS